ncbi:hypothetical protein ANTPLA_LOCUS10973 [Anthophora plagiata]
MSHTVIEQPDTTHFHTEEFHRGQTCLCELLNATTRRRHRVVPSREARINRTQPSVVWYRGTWLELANVITSCRLRKSTLLLVILASIPDGIRPVQTISLKDLYLLRVASDITARDTRFAMLIRLRRRSADQLKSLERPYSDEANCYVGERLEPKQPLITVVTREPAHYHNSTNPGRERLKNLMEEGE